MSFVCKACGKPGHPAFDLNAAGKLVAQCPNADCQAVDPTVGPEATIVEKPKGQPPRPMAVASPFSPPPAPAAHVPPHATPQPAAVAGDVLGTIRARREWLILEIARLDGLRGELAMLDKMMCGAKRRRRRKPAQRATVTPLRSVSQ